MLDAGGSSWSSVWADVEGSSWSSVWADVEGFAWAWSLYWADCFAWAYVEGLTWAGGLTLTEGLTWAEFLAEVLIGVEVEGSLLISKSTSFGRVTFAATGMSDEIGFRVILMPDLKSGNVSDGAVGWGNGKKKSVANMASTDMFIICGNWDTIACISVAWSVSSIKIKWSNLFIQIKFNLYR